MVDYNNRTSERPSADRVGSVITISEKITIPRITEEIIQISGNNKNYDTSRFANENSRLQESIIRVSATDESLHMEDSGVDFSFDQSLRQKKKKVKHNFDNSKSGKAITEENTDSDEDSLKQQKLQQQKRKDIQEIITEDRAFSAPRGKQSRNPTANDPPTPRTNQTELVVPKKPTLKSSVSPLRSPLAKKNNVTFESQRNQVLQNYKNQLNKIENNVFGIDNSSKLQDFGMTYSRTMEDSKFESFPTDKNKKPYADDHYSPDFKNKKGGGLRKFDARRQKLDERVLAGEDRAEQYLKNQTPEGNQHLGFVTRDLLYQNKTINESYDQLRKKTEELEDIMGDVNFKESQRVSRPSWRNTVEIKEYSGVDEDMGFFDKLKNIFTCVNTREKVTAQPVPSNNRRVPRKK